MTDGFNLLELRIRYPHRFYEQTWWLSEGFARVLPNEPHPAAPRSLRAPGLIPQSAKGLPLAVDLAHAFVRSPDADVWNGYLWCRDVDKNGDRVYVGGANNGRDGSARRLEVHRHLTIGERWGCAVW